MSSYRDRLLTVRMLVYLGRYDEVGEALRDAAAGRRACEVCWDLARVMGELVAEGRSSRVRPRVSRAGAFWAGCVLIAFAVGCFVEAYRS